LGGCSSEVRVKKKISRKRERVNTRERDRTGFAWRKFVLDAYSTHNLLEDVASAIGEGGRPRRRDLWRGPCVGGEKKGRTIRKRKSR